jgi:hypothetical protein
MVPTIVVVDHSHVSSTDGGFMRTLRVVAVLAALFVVGGQAVASASTTPRAASGQTQRIVLRPVTAAGHAAPGFKISVDKGGVVDCSYEESSSAAVDRDIVQCAPDAEYAIACWKAAYPHRVLCLRDPRTNVLTSIYTEQSVAQTSPPKPKDVGPLELRLRNGLLCFERDGGTGVELKQHPTWYATYYCTKGMAIWAPSHGGAYGITQHSSSFWTAHVGNENGKHGTTVRYLTRVWLVGTAS